MATPDRVSRDRGAVRAHGGDDGGKRKSRKGIVWLVLGLAALALLALLLILLIDGGKEKPAPQAGGPPPAQQGAPSAQPTAGGQPVALRDLRPQVGQTASAQAAVVQAVNPNEGFWVGTSQTDRVYVEYGGDVGETEATFVPQVGQKVNLTGPVRAAPKDPGERLNLTPPDAQQVKSQGGYVNADRVTSG